MKILTPILLMLLMVACTQKKRTDAAETPVSDDDTAIYAHSKMTLVGEAQQVAITWEDYQQFITELENYDHSKPATNRLTELADNMVASIPSDLIEQPVMSRLVVLRTRIGIYGSAIRNNSISKKERVKKYNDMILALDQFHIQLNEKLNYDQNILDLLKTLEGEFEEPTDSIVPAP
ncbi:MAG: hypothetical protein NWQ19_07850 [Nonlabens sp.]|nr:hypothetical protein [Nonlabens sp.]